jgi:hypothetical protein
MLGGWYGRPWLSVGGSAMKGFVLALLTLFTLSIIGQTHGQEQTPLILSVTEVVAGTQKLDTTFLYAVGQWSDSTDNTSANSTQIHCYKRFSVCEVASADSLGGPGSVYVTLDSFDIVRWDKQEMIAIDSSPICLVNTLRADFVKHKVTLSSTSKGETKNKYCEGTDTPTAFLGGADDAVKRTLNKRQK